MALIRSDEVGPYVLTGGYAFRPPAESTIKSGDHVPARHRGGTTTAKVGGELWQSFSSDPQYKSYVGVNPREAEWRSDPRTRRIYESNDRAWDDYKTSIKNYRREN